MLRAEYHRVNGTAWLSTLDNPVSGDLAQGLASLLNPWFLSASSHDLMENNPPKAMAQLSDASSSDHKFLGLKWKVLLLSSLILIAIVVSFTGITYRSLMNDFENQRDVQHQRYAP